MTPPSATGATLGLYSIGVRGLTVPALLAWAREENIPFLHLRGGPRGFDLARRDAGTLRRWARAAEGTVPISGVTADVDLADLLTAVPFARAETVALAHAARTLGAGWVRLLARVPPSELPEPPYVFPEPAIAVHDQMLLLVELHHPGWLQPGALAALEELLAHTPYLRLLTDTTQLHQCLPADAARAERILERVLEHTVVLHLCDNGEGTDGVGHRRAIEHAARRIAAGHRLEVAFEWTGADRSPNGCLVRYRAAAQWWAQIGPAGASRSE